VPIELTKEELEIQAKKERLAEAYRQWQKELADRKLQEEIQKRNITNRETKKRRARKALRFAKNVVKHAARSRRF